MGGAELLLLNGGGSICINEIFSGFTKSHPAYSKEGAMRLSDKWEEQILLIMRFPDWKKQIKNNNLKKEVINLCVE